MSSFSKIMTAEFQVVTIDATNSDAMNMVASSASPSKAHGPGLFRTGVRYELVGSGQVRLDEDFHREQRVGYWELEWEASPASSSSPSSTPIEFRLRKWLALNETQGRAADPAYIDIAAHAFGSNRSYSSQLLRGADYWRTVLDGA